MEYIFSAARWRPLNSLCHQVSDCACAKCHRKVCLPKVVPLLRSLDQSTRRQNHVLCGTFKFDSVVDIVSHRWISLFFAANGVKPNRQILSVNQLLTADLKLKRASPRTAVKSMQDTILMQRTLLQFYAASITLDSFMCQILLAKSCNKCHLLLNVFS